MGSTSAVTNIVSHFERVQLAEMTLPTELQVPIDSVVIDVVGAMAAADLSCAVVTESDRIAGIFTERDVTHRVARSPDMWDLTIDKFMTFNPSVASARQTAFDALREMNRRSVRNLPIADDDGTYLGTVTFYDLIRLASDFLRAHPDVGHELAPEHSLLYVDLTGIGAHPPVTMEPTTSAGTAIDAMIGQGTGLVSVVNDRQVVIGEFTEHDIFTKLACQVEDLDDEIIGDWMTTVIAGARPQTSIADGLHLMADVGHRYLLLLNENEHALGVLTFGDIADYIEAAFAVA